MTDEPKTARLIVTLGHVCMWLGVIATPFVLWWAFK